MYFACIMIIIVLLCHCSVSYVNLITGQLSAEQRLQARQVLESVQVLERQRQQLEFQGQQVQLNLQQAQDAQAMEKQFQEAMQIQQQGSAVIEGRVHPMKLALRKRYVCVCVGGGGGGGGRGRLYECGCELAAVHRCVCR